MKETLVVLAVVAAFAAGTVFGQRCEKRAIAMYLHLHDSVENEVERMALTCIVIKDRVRHYL